MPHINDDMDKLFRKAAEDYQLNTNSGDFKKVLSKLKAAQDLHKKGSKNNNNNRRFLFLLLLLPLGFVYYLHNQPGGKVAENNKNEEKLTSAPNDKLSVEDVVSNSDEEKPIAPGNQNGISNNKNSLHQPYTNPVEYSADSKTFEGKLESEVQLKEKETDQNFKMELNDPLTNPPEQAENANTVSDELFPKKSNIQTGNVKVESQADSMITFKEKEIAKQKKQTKTNGFYAGVLGGVDISTIKYQLIKDVGFNAGIVVGYQINKRLSAEVLVLVDKKQYYTIAKHFDNSKVQLPYFPAVKTIEGDCKMIEGGLNAKYNFVSAGKSKLYAVGGFSSFFMNSENYSYKYVASTTYYRNYSYKNKSKHLFAVLNLGTGYEHSLNNKTVLRIEPYLKVPLSRVGIGKLPISSSGINLGIVRKF
jgi:hypothetical protein